MTLSGHLRGLPRSRKGITVAVKAISLKTGEDVAATLPAGSRYSLRVPAGPYLVQVDVLDQKKKRHATSYKAVNAKGRRAGADLTVRRAAAAAGATIGVGAIPVTAPPGVIPGGGAEGPIITGLLPICKSKGGKLLDKTRKSKDAIKAEQKLADDGKLGFKFHYSPLGSDATLTGTVGIGPNGGPKADLTVSDTSGNTIKHYVVGGDPADWADFGKWARGIGSGLGRDLTQDPDDDPCEPHAATVTVTYSGSYNVTATNYTVGEAMETQTENANWTFSWTGPLSDLSNASGRTLQWASEQLTGSTSDTHTSGGPNCSGSLSATPGQAFDSINTSSPAAPQLQLSTRLPGYQAASCALHLGCPGPPVSNGGDYCHPSVVWKPTEGEKTYTFSGNQNVGSVAGGRTVTGSAQTSVKVAPS